LLGRFGGSRLETTIAKVRKLISRTQQKILDPQISW